LLRSPRLALFDCSLRSLRCSLRAAVFVESDETITSQNQLWSGSVSSAPPAERRREHRVRGSRLGACLLRRHSRTKNVSRRSSSARRVARSDLIASLAKARSVRLLAPLAAMFAASRRLRRIRRNDHVAESALVSKRFVGSSCRTAARTSRARIALLSRSGLIARFRATMRADARFKMILRDQPRWR